MTRLGKDAMEDELSIPDNLDACRRQLSETLRKLEQTEEKYLRAAADVENIRKWTERNVLARAKEDQRSQLQPFLEVIDNLERALSQPAELITLYRGVELTMIQLKKALANAGVEPIKAEPGDPFDPNYHEGVGARYGEVDEPAIDEVVQTGYLYENELLRPARVTVIKPRD